MVSESYINKAVFFFKMQLQGMSGTCSFSAGISPWKKVFQLTLDTLGRHFTVILP